MRDNGSLAPRFDVVRVPAEQTLSQYLGSGWIENVEEKTIEAFDINGLPAATAIAKGDQWMFRLYAIRYNDDVYRFIFAAKQMTWSRPRLPLFGVDLPPHGAERDRVGGPLRLRVVTVTPGDTAERMASRMPLVDRPLERFLILNGLNQGDALTPGEKVKVVTE